MEETMEFVNNSGQGKGTVVPVGVKGYNWGAFTLSWIWGIGNSTWITFTMFVACLVAIVPIVGWLVPLGLCIWFGLKGNEWAWQNKKWDSLEHFHKVQKTWATVGLILFLLNIALSVVIVVLGGLVSMMGSSS